MGKTKRVKANGSTAIPAITTNKADQVDWPPLQSLIPTCDLYFDVLLQDQVITIPRLWTASLCKTYVAFLKTLPLLTTPGIPKKGHAVRVNDRFQIDDPVFAERLWSGTGLKALVEESTAHDVNLTKDAQQLPSWGGRVLGLNPNIRIYRYTQGQFFDKHFDDSNDIEFYSATEAKRVPAKTTWTLLLYLTSAATGCQGGETVFYPDPPSRGKASPPPVVVSLDVGMALLHKHGQDCLLHEGREVTAGEKWVIRTDLVVER